jgi:hypothetical protein
MADSYRFGIAEAPRLFLPSRFMSMLAVMARPRNLAALTGRPSKFTLEAAVEVLQRMNDGEPLYRICQDEHLPSPGTIRNWASNPRHGWFGAAFKEAQKNQAHAWFEECVGIADELQHAEAAHQVFAGQTRIRARQWACSRIVPEEYGERVPPAAIGGAQIHIYLPGKPEKAGDGARVIDGSARAVEDGTDEPGTD